MAPEEVSDDGQTADGFVAESASENCDGFAADSASENCEAENSQQDEQLEDGTDASNSDGFPQRDHLAGTDDSNFDGYPQRDQLEGTDDSNFDGYLHSDGMDDNLGSFLPSAGMGPIQRILAQEACDRRRLQAQGRAITQDAAATAARRRTRETVIPGIKPSWNAGKFLHSYVAVRGATESPRMVDHNSPGARGACDWESFHQRNNNFLAEKEHFLEMLRQRKSDAEVEECTFRPNLGEKDAYRFSRNANINVYDRGVELKVMREARLEQMRQRKADKEMEECTFHPQPMRPSSCSTPTFDSRVTFSTSSAFPHSNSYAVEARRRSNAGDATVGQSDQGSGRGRGAAALAGLRWTSHGPRPSGAQALVSAITARRGSTVSTNSMGSAVALAKTAASRYDADEPTDFARTMSPDLARFLEQERYAQGKRDAGFGASQLRQPRAAHATAPAPARNTAGSGAGIPAPRRTSGKTPSVSLALDRMGGMFDGLAAA